MAIGFSDLPLEILENVLQPLNSRNIKAVRLACRQLNQAASRFLIRTVWMSTQPQDWEKMKAIFEPDIFSKRVREVVYESVQSCPGSIGFYRRQCLPMETKHLHKSLSSSAMVL